MLQDKKYTVTELVTEIKNSLEESFKSIILIGEITNLNLSSSGHYYFSISDREASISGALFKGDALRNPHLKKIKDGDKVICYGSVGVYSKRGTFQLIVRKIESIGKGDLLAQYEVLKKKLSSEGLFDISEKKSIPTYALRVAIITSKEGAAIHDFINVFKRRSIWSDLLVVPATVQGPEASKSLRKALVRVLEYNKIAEKKVDSIVFTRGGGSLEDLWAFNDEELARDIFNCPIPVISAVGHQVDYTICDFVADLRCETPSAAAEILTNGQTKLLQSLIDSRKRLLLEIRQIISLTKNKLEEKNPKEILNRIWRIFLGLQKRLDRAKITHRFYQLSRLHEKQLYLDDLSVKAIKSISDRVTKNISYLEKLNELLRVLNPNNVLGRGYVFLRDESKKIIGSYDIFSDLKEGESLQVQFKDGIGQVIKRR